MKTAICSGASETVIRIGAVLGFAMSSPVRRIRASIHGSPDTPANTSASRFATLEEVIEHYSGGVKRGATLDPNLAKHPDGSVPLSKEDKQALIAFLKTLTDDGCGNLPPRQLVSMNSTNLAAQALSVFPSIDGKDLGERKSTNQTKP